jgi:hypothetical protein
MPIFKGTFCLYLQDLSGKHQDVDRLYKFKLWIETESTERMANQSLRREMEPTLGQYSGCKITLSLSYIIVRGKGRWKGQGGARWQLVCLSMYSVTKNIFSLLISTQSVAF